MAEPWCRATPITPHISDCESSSVLAAAADVRVNNQHAVQSDSRCLVLNACWTCEILVAERGANGVALQAVPDASRHQDWDDAGYRPPNRPDASLHSC
jgi:hypothetical protein